MPVSRKRSDASSKVSEQHRRQRRRLDPTVLPRYLAEHWRPLAAGTLGAFVLTSGAAQLGTAYARPAAPGSDLPPAGEPAGVPGSSFNVIQENEAQRLAALGSSVEVPRARTDAPELGQVADQPESSLSSAVATVQQEGALSRQSQALPTPAGQLPEEPASIEEGRTAVERTNEGGRGKPPRRTEAEREWLKYAAVDPVIASEHKELLKGGAVKVVNFQGPTFIDGAEIGDVRQGALADCYLAAALSSLAMTNPGVIEEMVQVKKDEDGKEVRVRGQLIYEVTFKEQGPDGKWRDVVIPVDGDLYARADLGTPIYGRGYGYPLDQPAKAEKQMELWFALVEKAYAKWRGVSNDRPYYSRVADGRFAGEVFTAVLASAARWQPAGTLDYQLQSPENRMNLPDILADVAVTVEDQDATGSRLDSTLRVIPFDSLEAKVREVVEARLNAAADYLRSPQASETLFAVMDSAAEIRALDPFFDTLIKELNWLTIQRSVDNNLPANAGSEPILGTQEQRRATLELYEDKGVYPWHMYSVIGYKVIDGERYVMLANPWRTAEPKDDRLDGVNDGVFLLTLDEFTDFYRGVAYMAPTGDQQKDAQLYARAGLAAASKTLMDRQGTSAGDTLDDAVDLGTDVHQSGAPGHLLDLVKGLALGPSDAPAEEPTTDTSSGKPPRNPER